MVLGQSEGPTRATASHYEPRKPRQGVRATFFRDSLRIRDLLGRRGCPLHFHFRSNATALGIPTPGSRTVDSPPVSACAADRTQPIDQLPTTARIEHPIESTATALRARAVHLLHFRIGTLAQCAPCERRRATTVSRRAAFSFREVLFGNFCVVCLPAGVIGRPLVRMVDEGSISNTKDKINEVPYSIRIACFRAVGGLPGRYVGTNFGGDGQCITATARHAANVLSCDGS